jgi:hypothetical protein
VAALCSHWGSWRKSKQCRLPGASKTYHNLLILLLYSGKSGFMLSSHLLARYPMSHFHKTRYKYHAAEGQLPLVIQIWGSQVLRGSWVQTQPNLFFSAQIGLILSTKVETFQMWKLHASPHPPLPSVWCPGPTVSCQCHLKPSPDRSPLQLCLHGQRTVQSREMTAGVPETNHSWWPWNSEKEVTLVAFQTGP